MFPKNVLLEEIAAKLSALPFPLEEAVEEYITNFRYTTTPSFSQIIGGVAELGISQTLFQISEDYESRLVIDPIRQKIVHQGKYVICYNRAGQLVTMDHLKQYQMGEYDGLFLVDGLPVVVEVKLIGGRHQLCSKQRFSHALSLKFLQKRLRPLQEYFAQPIGHLTITYPQRITARSPVQQKYLDAGGILIAFPMDRFEYCQQLAGAFLERLVERRR